jgi:hypothetical protein
MRYVCELHSFSPELCTRNNLSKDRIERHVVAVVLDLEVQALLPGVSLGKSKFTTVRSIRDRYSTYIEKALHGNFHNHL